MDDSSSKKWIIKDASGRVRGPYATDEVLSRIRRGDFGGEEQVALFPGTDWFPISSAPEFYDQLLASLEGDPSQNEVLDEGFVGNTPTPSELKEDNINIIDDLSWEKPKKRGSAERVSSNEKKDEPPKKEKVRDKDRSRKKNKEKDPDVIELKRTKKVLKKAKRKSMLKPTLVLVLVVVGAFIILDFGKSSSGEAIRLLVPEMGKDQISKEKVTALTNKAIQEFTANNSSNLISAQNTLVQLFEGDKRNSAALSLLCLTYLELWPMAYQDSQDLQALTRVNQLASQLDPGGIDGNTCRVVDLYLRRRAQEADSTVDSVIERSGNSENPPIA